MKKFIKVIIGLLAVFAAAAGAVVGVKLWLKKKCTKAESEEFIFEGDDFDEPDAEFSDDRDENN